MSVNSLSANIIIALYPTLIFFYLLTCPLTLSLHTAWDTKRRKKAEKSEVNSILHNLFFAKLQTNAINGITEPCQLK